MLRFVEFKNESGIGDIKITGRETLSPDEVGKSTLLLKGFISLPEIAEACQILEGIWLRLDIKAVIRLNLAIDSLK